jgi:hypothetical protein
MPAFAAGLSGWVSAPRTLRFVEFETFDDFGAQGPNLDADPASAFE